MSHRCKAASACRGWEDKTLTRDAAIEVEQAGKAGDLTQVTHWIPELETQIARLNEALQQWLVDPL
jgi:hypothetical protein